MLKDKRGRHNGCPYNGNVHISSSYSMFFNCAPLILFACHLQLLQLAELPRAHSGAASHLMKFNEFHFSSFTLKSRHSYDWFAPHAQATATWNTERNGRNLADDNSDRCVQLSARMHKKSAGTTHIKATYCDTRQSTIGKLLSHLVVLLDLNACAIGGVQYKSSLTSHGIRMLTAIRMHIF